MINLALSNKNGDIYEIESHRMIGASGATYRIPNEFEMISLPAYSHVFYLPGTSAVILKDSGRFTRLDKSIFKDKLYPIAAFLPPGYLRLLFPAYKKNNTRNFPLWAYTAAGIRNNKFCAAALKIDSNPLWDPSSYDDRILEKKIRKRTAGGRNRLLKQLKYCALNYHCFTAKNVFLEKNECAIPVSKFCNASCAGCISSGDSFGFPASQHRIDFTPSVDEILEVALYHIKNVKDAIISFGQGCEGEPLLQAGLIEESVRAIRKLTKKGTININTNGSIPEALIRLAASGLDSARISLNSTIASRYVRYYRPKGFGLEDVFKSISVLKKKNVFVALNLLTFPGVTDGRMEVKGLINLIKRFDIDMIQFRNLNIDPYLYLKLIKPGGPVLGLINLIGILKEKSPRLKIGYFNIPKNKFSS